MIRIGVDLGGTKIEAVAMADDGSVLLRERVATPRGSYSETLAQIVGLVTTLETASADRADGSPARVGIGTPGAVSPATGRMKNANSTWLNDRPLREDLEAALRRPVRIANDANCFALSEAVDGAGQGARVVFGVILGTGVGGGIVIDGKLLEGPNAIAGEWGHNPLPDVAPGTDCYCGRRGCVETRLSGPALTRDFADEAGLELPAPEIVRLAQEPSAENPGDALARVARVVLARYEDRLARALATVINLLDPDVIVLGGGMSNVKSMYTAIPARWTEHVFSDRVVTRLLPPVHGDAGGVRGAAWLWSATDAGRD